MKKFIIFSILLLGTVSSYGSQIVISSTYTPMSPDLLWLAALTNSQREKLFQEEMKNEYNKNSIKAYECLEIEDWIGFLLYSEKALQTGLYTEEIYYERAQAFKNIFDFKSAMKELKKLQKLGHYVRSNIINELKIAEKELNNKNKNDPTLKVKQKNFKREYQTRQKEICPRGLPRPDAEYSVRRRR